MKKHTIVMLLSVMCSIYSYAQTKKPIFVGIQPAITVEPFYADGEFDVNIFPLVVETPIGKRVNIRLTPIVNYHIGGVTNGISDVGLYTVLPVFFNARANKSDIPNGIYIGPVVGLGRNLINNHYTTTFAAEPGYMFAPTKSFTASIGCQLGGSHFSYDDRNGKWIFHWGPKISLGFWLNRQKEEAKQ